MPEQKYTRCPACKTTFRVTPEQLAIRAGQVRCGHCQVVFDGVVALVSLSAGARDETAPDEAALGPPTVTLRSAAALRPASEASEEAAAPPGTPTEPISSEAPQPSEVAYDTRFAWQEKKERRRLPAWFYGAALALLIVLFTAQAAFHFRDAIAAHWPATKPTLIRLCAMAGCEVRPLQDIAAISIEASDLQADPAHRGLLILTSTIRNGAPYTLAYPYLELSLSDTQEQVVVRRAFAPREYLSGAADPRAGMAPSSELAIKLFIDASSTTQAGYQVYLFYP